MSQCAEDVSAASLHLKSSHRVQAGHCIITVHLQPTRAERFLLVSVCTVVPCGSGASEREITGDYRNTYTSAPSVMHRVSAVLVSAGLWCMEGSSPVRLGQLALQLRALINATKSSRVH